MFQKLIIAIIISLSFVACGNKKTEPKQQGKEDCIISGELKKLIRFDVVHATQAAYETELTGNVSYNQDNLYRYQSLASGFVQKVHFSLGDWVEKGQIMAEIKTTELSEQKSSLSIYNAALKLADRNLKAVEKMYKDGLASDKELLEAQNEVNVANADINRVKESATIQGGNIERGVLVIRAPMSGYVVEKKITNGYQVNAGDDDLFVISDLKKIWVMANVYAAQLDKVKIGEQVEINTTAYPDKNFAGKITRLSNIFDPEEKVMKAIIEMDNPELLLKPDMMLSITVNQPLNRSVIALPVDHVIFANDANHVLVYHSDCNVELKTIAPFNHDRKYYYLDMDNGIIKDGDTIISQNHLLLYHKLNGIEM